MSRYLKTLDSTLDYTEDWATWLGSDTIATSDWAVPAGLTEVNTTQTATSATVWLSGGAAGTTYRVTNTITTAGGRIASSDVIIKVWDSDPDAHFCTLEQVKDRLNQLKATADQDVLLAELIEEATAQIRSYLGHDFGTAQPGTTTIYGRGTPFLMLPAHVAGSVTTVSAPAGFTVPAYVERDGVLEAVDSQGRRVSVYRDPWYADLFGPQALAWQDGVPYTVSATFGYGPLPADVRQVCVELVVNAWRTRDTGSYVDSVGVDGSGAQRFVGGLTSKQKAILDAYMTSSASIGVW